MRWLLNLVLLAAVAGLGWWVYLERQPEPPLPLVAAPAAGWGSIVVERAGDQDIRLQRTSSGWRLLAPREVSASAFHVGLIERFLAGPAAARYPARDFDLAAAGLRAPTLSLLIDGKRLAFGALEPLERRRYLLYGDEVLLVQDGISAILRSPWWNFIDRRLLPPGAEVAALEFGDGRRLDRHAAPMVLARWQDVSATMVKPRRDDIGGEAFVLVLESGERLRWQWLSGEQPRLISPQSELVYLVGAETLAALLGQKRQ